MLKVRDDFLKGRRNSTLSMLQKGHSVSEGDQDVFIIDSATQESLYLFFCVASC